MKIALFYPQSYLASWYTLGGYKNTLEKMGHEVLDCPLPGNQVGDVDRVRKRMPSPDDLNKCTVILSTFHEYVAPWLEAIYGLQVWKSIVPVKIARYDESFMDRTNDLRLKDMWPMFREYADHHSFPDQRDALAYNGQWRTFGADLDMFNPGPDGFDALRAKRKYQLAFIGTIYPIRQQYLQQLATQIKTETIETFNIGNPLVQDLSGIRGLETTKLLVENYHQIKIFFCLPPLCRMLIAKVFDIMAAGTFLMYPKWYHDSAASLETFEHEKEIVYYDLGQYVKNARQIEYWLRKEDQREEVAKAGYLKVHAEHGLDKMLSDILDLRKIPFSREPGAVVTSDGKQLAREEAARPKLEVVNG